MTADLTIPLATDPLIGATLGDEFRVTEKLGEGGMGAVYRATQKFTDRVVAVKVLHRHLYEASLFQRFVQEAQIVSKLNHPNIITVYKFGQNADTTLYLAMEYVDGRPLDTILAETGAFEVERALPLMIQMAEALAYAHDLKIVHRDIKPENMIVARSGRSETVKLLDFGIAKMLDNNASLTKTGMMVGSPAYMSPEQWKQVRDLDGRTDIYSLGCVFYEMMTGKLAHTGESALDYMMAHTTKPAPAPIESSRTLSALPALNDVIVQCMKIDREDRYVDAYALVEALREAQVTFEATRRGFTGSGVMRAPVVGTRSGQMSSAGEGIPEGVKGSGERPVPANRDQPSLPPPEVMGPGTRVSSAADPQKLATVSTMLMDAPSAAAPSATTSQSLRPLTSSADSTSAQRAHSPSIVPMRRDAKDEVVPSTVTSGKVHQALVGVGVFMLVALGIAVALVR